MRTIGLTINTSRRKPNLLEKAPVMRLMKKHQTKRKVIVARKIKMMGQTSKKNRRISDCSN